MVADYQTFAVLMERREAAKQAKESKAAPPSASQKDSSQGMEKAIFIYLFTLFM